MSYRLKSSIEYRKFMNTNTPIDADVWLESLKPFRLFVDGLFLSVLCYFCDVANRIDGHSMVNSYPEGGYITFREGSEDYVFDKREFLVAMFHLHNEKPFYPSAMNDTHFGELDICEDALIEAIEKSIITQAEWTEKYPENPAMRSQDFEFNRG